MAHYLERFTRSKFLKSSAILLSGSSLSQALPLLCAPLLSRIYSSEEFGAYALFISTISILTVISSGRYELALITPNNSKHVKNLTSLSLSLATLTSALTFAACLIAKDYDTPYLNGSYVYLLCPGLLVYSYTNIGIHLLNHLSGFKKMSLARVSQSAGTTSSQIVLGLTKIFNNGLVISDILGRSIAFAIISPNIISIYRSTKENTATLRETIRRYIHFPLIETPASLLNRIATQSPAIFVPLIFDLSSGGQYFLVNRIVMAPISLIGTAISETFRVRASKEIEAHGNCKSLFLKTLALLSALTVVPMLIVATFGPKMFSIVFGQSWSIAGEYAQILAPLAALRLISLPLSTLFFVREKLKWNLPLQLSFAISIILSIYFSQKAESVDILLTNITIAGSLFYLAQIVLSYRLSLAIEKNDRGGKTHATSTHEET